MKLAETVRRFREYFGSSEGRNFADWPNPVVVEKEPDPFPTEIAPEYLEGAGESGSPQADLRIIARVEDGRRYTFFVPCNPSQVSSEEWRLLEETHPTLTAYLPSAADCIPQPQPKSGSGEEGRLLDRLAEPADGHDIKLGERCPYRCWSEEDGYEACTLPRRHACNHQMQPEGPLAKITGELGAHPEVRWDRFIEYGGKIGAYGWLARSDGRADFLLLDFDAETGQLRDWITSAHPHPASVVERLEGEESVECRRVEDTFEIPNAVHLQPEESTMPSRPVPEESVEAIIELRCSRLAHRPAGDILYRWRIDAREHLEAAAPALCKQEREQVGGELRECEEALHSTQREAAEFRERMLEPLRDEGGSIESLSWDDLLGVANRNLNEGLRLKDELDKARQSERKQVLEELLSEKARRANDRAVAAVIEGDASYRPAEQWAIYRATVEAALHPDPVQGERDGE